MLSPFLWFCRGELSLIANKNRLNTVFKRFFLLCEEGKNRNEKCTFIDDMHIKIIRLKSLWYVLKVYNVEDFLTLVN